MTASTTIHRRRAMARALITANKALFGMALWLSLGAQAEPGSARTAAVAAVPAATPASRAAALGLLADAPSLTARYLVSVTPAAGARPAATRQLAWTFSRDARQIALQKGAIDEAWHRDAQGRVRFERIFHDEQRVVDYSPGELSTLQVQADWVALATFIDAHELLALTLVARSGRGADERLRLSGTVAGEAVLVEWLPALQLPALLVRTSQAHGSTRITLLQQHAVAPAGWPQPGARSADYLHLDAADFGDMDYDAVVKKSEALDIRLGWRAAHQHD